MNQSRPWNDEDPGKVRKRSGTHSFFIFVCTLLALTSDLRVSASKTRLTWINGIAYSMEDMEEGRREISRYFGGEPVIFCYNPTAMSHEDDLIGYLGDLTQAGTQKFGRITAEVESLVAHLRNAIASVGKKGVVVHIAHSQGALITSLAATKLTQAEMKQIEVLGFGGAATIRSTPRTPFHRCVNYYSVNDPILLVVPAAAQALRSGLVGDDEFCFLVPRLGDPVDDHHLLAPTYAQALAWEGARFQRQHKSLTYRASRSLWISLVSLLQLLDAWLRAVMRAILQPIFLLCVLVYQFTMVCARRAAFFLQPHIRKFEDARKSFTQAAYGEYSKWQSAKEKYEPVRTHVSS